ncbi:tRNA (cytosine(34)-C(5))-methyltransferase, mitochondrial-like [Branchiostoma floridae]|uniref:tRNA (Cytosine(34)-C(5))-methyltransferase, mitochondrial-like n=1 Tax=Branchiostoma floridae TaxID=7739 RepID=A0A9J7MHX7_BRAFL|nr:tRNA (cytosine(34)-C(5))-methyltransferase, mitochondrial-like [Branchiostoma floridae]
MSTTWKIQRNSRKLTAYLYNTRSRRRLSSTSKCDSLSRDYSSKPCNGYTRSKSFLQNDVKWLSTESLAAAIRPSGLQMGGYETGQNGSNTEADSLEEVDTHNSVEERREFKHNRVPSQLVLDHFDRQYGQQFGSDWSEIKAALMAPKINGILLNNFTELSSKVATMLEEQRLQNVSDICSVLEKTLTPHLNKHDEAQEEEAIGLSEPFRNHQRNAESKLKFYIHPGNRHVRFPNLKHVSGQLKQYFLQGAASLLPVLALDVQQDDSVLDMCAAPGGKSLALLQTAELGHLTSNEPDQWRKRRLVETLQSYIPQEMLATRVDVTKLSGVHFGDVTPNTFDKVLVDAPCSNDRSWLYNRNSVGMQMRMEDRRHLPQLQASLLRSALHAVKPGGSVVYATCTLSLKENDDVVESVFEQFSKNKSRIDVINLSYLTENFWRIFRFDSSTRCGQLVLPHLDANWGPMYFAKLKKVH